ncbi:ABC transporter ATP-binding protein [Mycoplasmopsis cynos]|uniref:ABC transporter ATP-binding protein n=1 Tax=Mycoplasmopsis cynos TaxID=171284 RepID=A0A449AI11_9BACT|nr:ABC transporter ATP-binding protein [Mycoplasmopsis cynos]WQQ13427.1 ABC transporter ATP-binding protein [Mycoplasmopsis cynos]WQQ13702.1 ABC transporter ATP-binding protein [Mycoplasmopsis cynos]WQQ14330.1 ABC transporter ATP-binding protein [Mycoplasmopsis cynos]WQQ15437.1 ABC transporter ATP-binding protein [Mycoplasmopsis cynos]WQQ16453.1 ABC transporter ATP-binding protein [Mycoplasmopsis cynos]
MNMDQQINKETVTYVEKKFPFRKIKHVRYQTKGVEQMLQTPKDKNILASLRNVDITYGSGLKAFRAVTDINLNIYEGEVLGLVGESGSGKSTLGRSLVSLVPYSFGEIKLLNRVLPKKLFRGFKFGKRLKEYKEIDNFLVNKLQMIFQDPANSLNPHANVETIVSEGLKNTKKAKEIWIYNNDQATLKEVYKKIDPEKYQNEFYGTYLKTLNKEVYENEFVAYESIYVKLINKIKEYNLIEALEILNTKHLERLEMNKLTEKEARKLLVRDILISVGLDESVLRRYPLEFSGGQQQRIGISRAVVLRPQLLIADEPISALDVSIQAQVVNIFNELKEKYNLTILFIAHDLRMVEYISDRIAVMNKGRILEVGKTEEIMKHSLHPYTKSLLDAVPSIKSKKGRLIGYVYDPKMHNYTHENQPEWIKINDDHFVLGTKQEVESWKQGKY